MSLRAPSAVDAGVPDGTVLAAGRWAERAAIALTHLTGRHVTVDTTAVAAHVLLPAVLAARDGGGWARPARPRPAPGGGFLAADLGAPGDEELYDRLLATLSPAAPAETVEAAAQEWRLPVVAYGPAGAVPSPGPSRNSRSVGGARATGRWMSPCGDPARPLAGLRVVDLTAMWAGPLATWLLADLGADVTKIESAVRPDGMRGQRALFAALDRGKDHLDLDLRDPAAFARLETLIADADVIIDSFSPRVMPNLGLGPERLVALNPRIVAVSCPAFPPGTPQASWVSYGTGVHAFAGLGDLGGGRVAAPEVTYPDPLGGLATFAGVVEGLAMGGGALRVTSLLSAIAPLASPDGRAARGGLTSPVEPVACALADDLIARGCLDEVGIVSPFKVEAA